MRRSRTMAMVVIGVLLVAWPAMAQRPQPWTTAQRLLQDCAEPLGFLRSNSCVDYIEGIKDLLNYLRANDVSSIRLPCTPPNITLGQMRDVILKFLRDNPQYEHINGAPAVYAALIAAFPCAGR